jgi:hypothetical protein
VLRCGRRNPGERHAWLAHAATALALGSIALFLGTRGLLDPINHCDAISPVHPRLGPSAPTRYAWPRRARWCCRSARWR